MMIIYDCEIIKAILNKNEDRLAGIEYCNGWGDFAGMGVSVICVYDYDSCRYRVFCADNFGEFQELVNKTDIIVGFNSLRFDSQLCLANGIIVPVEKSYDLLAEIWHGAGLSRTFQFQTHTGYSLEACSQANLGVSKTGSGAGAQIDWQRGKIGKVIDYCLSDIFLTKSLLDLVIEQGSLINPKNISQTLTIYKPGEPKSEKEFTRPELSATFGASKKVKVVFTKKDGSLRDMICTTDLESIPPVHLSTSDQKPTPDHLFKVFDLEKNDWRSFTIANVISVEVVA